MSATSHDPAAPRKDPSLVLPAIPLLRETRSLTDPRCPGEEFAFALAVPTEVSEADALFLADRVQRLTDHYVRGEGRIVGSGGRRFPVEETLCLCVAGVMEAEEAACLQQQWTFEQWVTFSYLAPTAWQQLQAWYADLLQRAQGDAAEEAAASGAALPKNG